MTDGAGAAPAAAVAQRGKGRRRPAATAFEALLAALRALALFFLLRFALVHAAVAYLAFFGSDSVGAVSNGTAGAGVEATAGANVTAVPEEVKTKKVKKKEKKKEKEKEIREVKVIKPREPPPPIIRTVTKKIVQEQKATGLTPDQIELIERELESYVPPGFSADDASSEEAKAETLSAQIVRTIDELERVSSALKDDLLPGAVKSGEALEAYLATVSEGDMPTGQEKEEGAAIRRRRYGTLLPNLSSLLDVDSYSEWDDDTLESTFEGAVLDVSGVDENADGDKDVLADVGMVFETALGDRLRKTEQEGDDGGENGTAKVCSPSFLQREAPDDYYKDNGKVEAQKSAKGAAKTTKIDENTARASDLFAQVGSIELLLRDRTGRYSGILDGTSDDDATQIGPLTLDAGYGRFKKTVNTRAGQIRSAVFREKHKMDGEMETLQGKLVELQQSSSSMESGSEGSSWVDRTCVTEDETSYMLEEGLAALLRGTAPSETDLLLTDELVGALRVLLDERGIEGFDAESIDWTEGIALISDDNEGGKADVMRKDGGGTTDAVIGDASSDSSYAHRSTLRALVDSPLLLKLMGRVDDLADALGGYNEHVDKLIDTLAGDERDGSLGKTAGSALSDFLCKFPIPAEVKAFKEKAGVLKNGV